MSSLVSRLQNAAKESKILYEGPNCVVLKEPKLAASVIVPVVADGVFLLAYVHELGGDPPLLLALPHQPLHKHLLTPLLLYQVGNNIHCM